MEPAIRTAALRSVDLSHHHGFFFRLMNSEIDGISLEDL